MFKLSDFFDTPVKDGEFMQTQFAGTSVGFSICFVGHKKYVKMVNDNDSISCVVTTGALKYLIDDDKGLVVSEHPEKEFYQLHNKLFNEYSSSPNMNYGVHDSACLHASAIVSEKVCIEKGVVISEGAIVLDYCYLEEGVFVGPGAIIGADGHFYKKYGDGVFKVQHSGGVRLKKNSQVLAGAVISKSLHADFTVLGEDSVLSVKANIAHGCVIGDRCLIAGNSQISGYTKLGNDVWIGPSSVVGNLLTIGDDVNVEIGSVVIKNIPDGERVSGNFATKHSKNIMDYMRKNKL